MLFKKSKKTKFYTFKGSGDFKYNLENSQKCPFCKVITISRQKDKYFGTCSSCGVRLYFFLLHPHQEFLNQIQNRIVLIFSGVATGKTTMNGFRVINHCLTTPAASVYVLAGTIEQRDKNVKNNVLEKFIDLEKDLIVCNKTRWVFKNKSTINFYTSDASSKIKSANASLVWLVECQEMKVEMFYEACQRIRAESAKKYKLNNKGEREFHLSVDGQYRAIVLEDRASVLAEGNINPNSWIRDFGVLQAHTIIGSLNTLHPKLKNHAKPIWDEEGNVKDVVAAIISPMDNPYNSKDFLTDLKTGKPLEWVSREFFGDLSLESGLILPNAVKYFVGDDTMHQQFEHSDPSWEWIEAMDFGGPKIKNDPTAYLLAKYRPSTGEIYIIAEYYQSGKSIQADIQAINQIRAIYGYEKERSRFFVCDPSGRKSLKTSMGALDTITMYRDSGLQNLKPAFASGSSKKVGDSLVQTGLIQLKRLFDNNRIKISYNLVNLHSELKNYRKEALNETQIRNKSKTINTIGKDHAIDALRYMIMTLPFTEMAIDVHSRLPKKEGNSFQKEYNRLLYQSVFGDEKKPIRKNLPPRANKRRY